MQSATGIAHILILFSLRQLLPEKEKKRTKQAQPEKEAPKSLSRAFIEVFFFSQTMLALAGSVRRHQIPMAISLS